MTQSAATGLRFVRSGAIAIVIALVCALGATNAQAAVFASGQQEAWAPKNPGTGHNELFDPLMLGVDSTDGSVYVSDLSETLETARIQKFSQSGQFEAATTSPISMIGGGAVGIAVDGQREHFYVLKTLKQSGQLIAEKILVFSTVPTGEELVKTGEFTLPAVGSGEALVTPTEIAVDPNNGNLVVLAQDESESEQAVVQMINGQTGAFIARYTENGTKLPAETTSIAVDQDGVTYVVTAAGTTQSDIHAYTLPANFSSTPTLTPVPGFDAAAAAEEWRTFGAGRLVTEPATLQYGKGPQVAVASTPTGDVLYYKTEQTFLSATTPGVFYVHGYSVTGQATSAVYGGGTQERQCAIQTFSAALGVGLDESLVVLDQGEFVSSGLASFGPNVMRLGPHAEGSSCPLPAAALKLEAGGSVTGSVPSGTTVTLDGSGSELGGQLLTEMTWTVEDSSGTVVFTESKAAPTTTLDHQFTAPGDYTVRLKMKTSAPSALGNTVSAVPQTLEVTGGGTPVPSVSAVSPNQGPTAGGTSVTITGTELTGAEEVKFGSTSVACPKATAPGKCVVKSATEIEVESPAGAAGQVDVRVKTPGGTSAISAGDKFTYEAPVTPAPTCTGFTPATGPAAGGTAVTLTGTELTAATKVEFGTTQVTSFDEDTATQIKLKTPAHLAGPVPVKVTTAGGTATCAGGEFTYEAPVTPAPTVTSVSPTHGSTAGGETITIEGTNLGTPTGVSFGGTAGTAVTEVSATKLTVKSPAHAAGEVDVTVTTAGGTSATGAADKFTYEAPAPVTHTLTVKTAGTGSGSVTCNGGACAASYKAGTVVTLAASPASDSNFSGWSGGGCSGTGACTIAISADTTVTATFDKKPVDNPPNNPPKTGPPAPTPPSNAAKPGAVKPNSGGATLTVTVPGPGALVASGKGLVSVTVQAKKAGPVQLALKLTSAEKKTLAKKGKVTIKVKIVFTPTGGSPGVTTKSITFKAKAGRS